MSPFSFERIWGGATALLHHSRRARWIDLLLLLALAGLLLALVSLSREWTARPEPVVEIDLSLWALPGYTLFSLSRGLIAYLFSLGFTLVYGYWAARDPLAERVLVPLLDIFQSIPVLTFMPVFFILMKDLVPGTNVGLELVSILMIFTGQAWNMTFSFYHSLRSIPQDQLEAATVFRFGWWQRFKWVELPFATTGLVWNSMMSMAGGWFFLMVCEAFQLGEQDFRLPGLGSYMSAAWEQRRYDLMACAILAMGVMIVLLDQLLWAPVVVWAQKFRVEEGASEDRPSSWVLDWLRHSRLLRLAGGWLRRWQEHSRAKPAPAAPPADPTKPSTWATWVARVLFAALGLAVAYALWELFWLLLTVPAETWGRLMLAALATLGRVLAVLVLGTLWAVPAGLAIGLSPRLRQRLQPVVQFLASFPAPMVFPLVLAVLNAVGVSLNWGSIALMMLGTQWYILFNVVAGATSIPADLREATESFRLGLWQRFWVLYLPAVFPYLVTGWVTAAGGAWNTSIVAEYIKGEPEAFGLGAMIQQATLIEDPAQRSALVAASALVMAAMVVGFNRLLWRRLYDLAATRFSLSS